VTLYEEVWLPDLAYILKGDEARPVTRLAHGTAYAVGILVTTRRSARELRPAPTVSPSDIPRQGQKREPHWVPRTQLWLEGYARWAMEFNERLLLALKRADVPHDRSWRMKVALVESSLSLFHPSCN